MGHGFSCGDGSGIHWHHRTGIIVMLFVYLSVLSLSSLRGVHSCGGYHMIVSVLAWARYRPVRFLLHKTETRNPAGCFLRFDQSEGVNLPTRM